MTEMTEMTEKAEGRLQSHAQSQSDGRFRLLPPSLQMLLVALVFALVGGVLLPAGAAFAGTGSNAGKTNSSKTQPADPCDTSASKPALADPTPVKTCQNGEIEAQVSSPREFGYRIGDVIPIRVVIVASNAVLIDFSSLTKDGVIDPAGSAFQLAADDPVSIGKKSVGAGTQYTIDLNVQSFRPFDASAELVFRLVLAYSTGYQSGARFAVLTLPDFVVAGGQTFAGQAVSGGQIEDGQLSSVTTSESWRADALIAFGLACLIVFLLPGRRLSRLWRRFRSGRRQSASQVARSALSESIASGRRYGFGETQFTAIAGELQRYFEVENLSSFEALERLQGHPRAATIGSALRLCDKALYATSGLSDLELNELLAALDELIPRR